MATTLFIVLVILMAALHVTAVAVSGRRLGHRKERLFRDMFIADGVLMALLLISYAAAASGLLADFSRMPPRIMPFITAHFVLTLALGLSAYGNRLATGLPVWAIVGFQAFRIPVELLLHAFYEEGRIPVQMTYSGRNFDIITGITAIAVAWLAWRGTLTRGMLHAWNFLGLALLINIVTIAILSMPTAFRVFQNEPANRFVADPPHTWLPTILVTSALLGHIVVFRIPASQPHPGKG